MSTSNLSETSSRESSSSNRSLVLVPSESCSIPLVESSESIGKAHNTGQAPVLLTSTNQQICVQLPLLHQPPPQPSATQIHLKKLRERTAQTFKEWTKGMVVTMATRTILNKIDQGRSWVTVTGCPGEGKTTAGYLVLKHLHDRGREVFDIQTPDDYFKAKEVKHSVIMLNDIFGALTFDSDRLKTWQNVMVDIFALSEHKHEENDKSTRTRSRKKPDLTVILISRLSILKEAYFGMGRFKHLLLRDDNMVDLTNTVNSEESERIQIWNCHAQQKDIIIDTRTVRDVCRLRLSHGFAHSCKLFADMYKKNNLLDMKHFFSKPLDFLNQSMESLIEDSHTGPLLREMLKKDGRLNLKDIDDHDRRIQFFTEARKLIGTYLVSDNQIIQFNHPSVYDSAAFCICQLDPQFVISLCSLSFLNERVRLRELSQNDTIHSYHTVSLDNNCKNLLFERFLAEFHAYNISAVFSHPSFHDDGFVSKFMQMASASSIKLTKMKYVKYKVLKHVHYAMQTQFQKPISKYLKKIFHFCDIQSNKSFLFLMTKSGSDKLLRYIHQYVELTEHEQKETLFGICEHSSVSSLEYLLQKYKDINLEVTDQCGRTPLIVSAQKGSQDMIRILLTRNANINAKDNKGRTPLLNVCKEGVDGDGSVVRLLVEKGADTTFSGRQSSQTPLSLACQAGHTNVVRALLDMGVNVNTTSRNGDTPLHEACMKGYVNVVSALLEKGAEVNTTNRNGETCLSLACRKGLVDVASVLLQKLADVNTTDTYGFTPIHSACRNGYIDVVSALLRKGADINTKNRYGDTPLHEACSEGHVDIVLVLVNKNASVSSTNRNGYTPLHSACLKGYVNVVSLLINKGSDVNTPDIEDNTPLHSACSYGYEDVVLVLLDKDAHINTRNVGGETPLHSACRNGYLDVVSILLDKGADMNTTNCDGETPLHSACRSRYVDVVLALLNKGSNGNTKSKNGDTPLLSACRHNYLNVVSALLEKGTDIDTTNGYGETPLHLACLYQYVDIISVLLCKGADINKTDNEGDTPLHSASMRGYLQVVSALLNKGADMNTTNRKGNTPLHLACWNGYDRVVSVLIGKGADVNIMNAGGDTPFKSARFYGPTHVVH